MSEFQNAFFVIFYLIYQWPWAFNKNTRINAGNQQYEHYNV
jgi:hypothetical protein